MKYKYEFSTGDEEIEVSRKWDRILHELDHAENYSDIKETRSCVHYDAFENPGDLVHTLDRGWEVKQRVAVEGHLLDGRTRIVPKTQIASELV